MSPRSRILRGMLAASTLHLMLAVPARACSMEMQPAASHTMHEMSTPMSHAGHQMDAMAVPTGDQAPAPEAPTRHHVPCCPSPASACQGALCSAPAATLVGVAVSAPTSVVGAMPSLTNVRWASFAHAPEPPPPRA